jgi:hypothetical protein
VKSNGSGTLLPSVATSYIRQPLGETAAINPFLIRILSHELGLDNSEAIVRWLISQRLERGTVTSFGIALQDAAKVFSEGSGVEGADILKTKIRKEDITIFKSKVAQIQFQKI